MKFVRDVNKMSMENKQFDEDLPYIEYTIDGFRGSIMAGEERHFHVEDALIDSVEISQDTINITGIKVFLVKSCKIDETVEKIVTRKVKKFLINICGKMRGEITRFHLDLNEMYDPCRGGIPCYTMNCNIRIGVETSYAKMYKANVFKDAFDSELKCQDAEAVYALLYHVIQIENITTRYLMLYEILLGRVGKKHKQQEITEYIRNTYNPFHRFGEIGFHKTRKSGKNYEEDSLTYYRNLLEHSEMDESVDDETIRELSTRILEVIYYVCSDTENGVRSDE